jgi:hypothetical protein
MKWLEMEEVGFGMTGKAWNEGSSCLASLECLGMEEVGLGLTGMSWNGGSWFWPDWNVWYGGGRFWSDCNALK